jgi:glycosyltransferase involved in cell wall biosynthesis
MTRVVHLARYRHPMLDRKISLMAAREDLEFSLIRPLPARAQPAGPHIGPGVWLRLIGSNPHRAVYGSLSFSLRRLQPDLIHVEEEPDSLTALQVTVARRLFAPRARLILHTWQNVDRDKRWYVWAVIRHVLREADGVLAASEEARALLGRFGFRGQTAVVPQYGVDLKTFVPGEGRSSTAFTILYAGRLVPQKGIENLIDAVGRLDAPWQLLIVGDGPQRLALETRARSIPEPDRIRFIARVAPEDLARIMADVDVLVLPSRTTPVWKEQYGRILVEAMACQIPIAGSDSGAIPDVVGDAGLIFPEGDATALEGCLRRLAASPELRRALGTRGRARVLEHYSQEVVAAKSAAFYRDVMANRGKGFRWTGRREDGSELAHFGRGVTLTKTRPLRRGRTRSRCSRAEPRFVFCCSSHRW